MTLAVTKHTEKVHHLIETLLKAGNSRCRTLLKTIVHVMSSVPVRPVFIYNVQPGHTLSFKGDRCHGGKGSKESSALQPPDARIIHSVKLVCWSKQLVQHHFSAPGRSADVPMVSILDPLHFITSTWNLVSAETIAHCLHHSGFIR